MDEYSTDISRRTYLKMTGASSVAGLSSAAGCVGQLGGGKKKLTPGTAPGFPPFEMKNKQGELVGFDIDLLTAVVKQTDYELGEWKEFEFSSLIPALKNKRIDVIAAAMTITDKRDKTIDFTNPYYSADQAILVREGSDWVPSKLSDLSGHMIGAQEGTTGANVVQKQLIAKDKLKKSNFKTYGSYVLAVEDLENKNLDAVVVDEPVAKTFAEQRKVKIAFVYQTGEHYGFGVRENDDDVRKALNEGLAQVKQSGRYKEIRNKWFGESK